MVLLHGGDIPDRLHIPTVSAGRNVFGPGLYLTGDPKVAQCYVFRHHGSLWRVSVSGPRTGVCNFDRPLTACDRLPDYVHRLTERDRLPGESRYDQLAQLHGPGHDDTRTRRLNDQLRRWGIWLLMGHVGATAQSGLMDRGRQFVLLDPRGIERIQRVEASGRTAPAGR